MSKNEEEIAIRQINQIMAAFSREEAKKLLLKMAENLEEAQTAEREVKWADGI